MDLREALLEEHSKRRTMEIVDHIGGDARRFETLMRIFFEGEYRVTQRASWSVNYVAEHHPHLIEPYLDELLEQIEREDVHDAVRRNIFRLLQYVEIPECLKGKVYSLCVDFVDDAAEPVAVRVFALTVATRIAKSEPVLINELQLIVKKHLPYSSVAFHKRAREILSQ